MKNSLSTLSPTRRRLLALSSPVPPNPVSAGGSSRSEPRHWTAAAARLACALFASSVVLQAAETAVDQLNLRETQQSNWTVPRPGLAAGGGPLRVGGKTFAAGFGTVGGSRLELVLDGHAEQFRAQTGVDETSDVLTTVCFVVVGDGRVLHRGPWQQRGGPAVAVEVPLAGVHRLALVAEVRGEAHGRADWLAPIIVHAGAAPVADAPSREVDPQPPFTPPPTPRINPPARVGVRPGHPFLQRVNVAGARPMNIIVANLPSWLEYEAEHQVIRGTAPAAPGEFTVHMRAVNAHGAAAGDLVIVVGDTLALTPPMGWSSWYCMTGKVSDALARDRAAALLAKGLADHGWTYVNLDDYWMTRPTTDSALLAGLRAREATGRIAGYYKVKDDDPTLRGDARDAQGRIRPNARFPDMPALTAWLHAHGLKAGLYSSPGVLTCGGCTGSLGHETEDAAAFAAWGFDLLKYDWCSYYLEADRLERADWIRPYASMGAALRAQPRDLVFSLCQYGLAAVETWGASAGGQLWRTGSDLKDTWGAISAAGFFGEERDSATHPGSWNDLDMLMIGQIGMNQILHDVCLTPDERRTHFALWCLRGSPLLLAGDARTLDDWSVAFLSNDDAIAVNQDPLGRPAQRVVLGEYTEAWIRPLAGGAFAVGLFNRDEEAAVVQVAWSRLLPGTGAWVAHDLWRGGEVVPAATQGWQGSVRRHGVVFLRLEPADHAAAPR